MLKSRITNLYQITSLKNTKVEEIYYPLEHGLDIVKRPKFISKLEIVLKKGEPTNEDRTQVGF